ncbi:MAG: MFS transporter [Deltaproteobacteria bacterium]|nr:MFS transporter [Deltaproteobacteria bacterium]
MQRLFDVESIPKFSRRRNSSWFGRAGHHGIAMPVSPEYGPAVCLHVCTGFESGIGCALNSGNLNYCGESGDRNTRMFFGPVADRWGYRRMMLAGLRMLVVGMLAGGFLPFYGVVLVAVFLAGMGKSVFNPAIQAYIGERVPFKRRGLVVGLVEFSWAGSTLVGIPLIAIIIDRLDWRAPFLLWVD